MKLEIYGGPKEGGWSGHGEYQCGIDPPLEPCPFCGAGNVEGELECDNTHTPFYSVRCEECGAEGPSTRAAGLRWRKSSTKKETEAIHRRAFSDAIKAWNKRSAL